MSKQSNSLKSASLPNTQTTTKAKRTTSKAKGNKKTEIPYSPTNQTGILQLNLIHLLFLHGLVKTFYNSDGLDNHMKNFLHDMIIMFEVYIDMCEPSDVNNNLLTKYNYEPLKPTTSCQEEEEAQNAANQQLTDSEEEV